MHTYLMIIAFILTFLVCVIFEMFVEDHKDRKEEQKDDEDYAR